MMNESGEWDPALVDTQPLPIVYSQAEDAELQQPAG